MRFLADENFNNDILQDPVVLEYAAKYGYILLTHDERTMPNHAFDRLAEGLSFPGVFIISQDIPIRRVIEDLLLVVGASDPNEWVDQVKRLPL
jgi:hypothetical protein